MSRRKCIAVLVAKANVVSGGSDLLYSCTTTRGWDTDTGKATHALGLSCGVGERGPAGLHITRCFYG